MQRSPVYAITLANLTRTMFFSLLLIFSVTVKGQSVSAPVASVSYAGYENDSLFFKMKYNNETGQQYAITITDGDGSILFSKVYAERNFFKTFKVPSAAGNVVFIISNPKNKEEKKFQVSMEPRFTEEFSVTKISHQP